MNANTVTRHYPHLTAEERFRLILAAGARGDEVECDRLLNAGQPVTVSFRDHLPYVIALQQVSMLAYIDLLDEATFYLDALDLADDMRDLYGDADPGEAQTPDAGKSDGSEEEAEAESSPEDACENPACRRTLDAALAVGFMLKTKVDGWKLFCERMTVPPFLVWEGLPGFSRLQDAVALAEKTAFGPEEFLRWLNQRRQGDEVEATEVPLTIKGRAGALERLFRERVTWWGG
jgi:hypothetical protein